MANLLTTQILESGDRNAVVKIVGQLDTSDIVYDVPINPEFYDPNLGQLRVDIVDYIVEPGLTVKLWWDAAVPVLIETCSDSGKFNAIRFGGMQNNATDPTGSIGLSTEGWTVATTVGFTLTVKLVKQVNEVALAANSFLQKEDSGLLLQENGDKLILE